MDIFTATMIAERADGHESESEEQYYEAWQLLIDTGVCWKLQGWFGRTANALIHEGLCEPPPSARKRQADKVDGYDRDDLGESQDF